MPTKKPRVKILRPRNAAPNTAFTQVSKKRPHSDIRKIRVAMDPSDLADDRFNSESRYAVKGVVLYTYVNVVDYELEVGCRTPEKIEEAIYVANYSRRVPEAHFLDQGLVEQALEEFSDD